MVLNKKILVLTDWYHPGFKGGGPIQSCRNLVSALKDDFEFYVFTSDRDLGSAISYSSVPLNEWVEKDSGEKVFYCSPTKFSIGLLFDQIKCLQPEVIYLNSMFSLNFTILPLVLLLVKGFKRKIVLAPRGMLYDSALSYKPIKKKIFLTFFRLSGIHKFISFHATDLVEQKAINRVFPKSKSISFAPNFANQGRPDRIICLKEPSKLKLVFYSRISPIKNLLFIANLFNKFAFQGIIEFTIAGVVEDNVYWQKCLDVLQNMPPNIHFEYIGPVENDQILNWLQQFHFLILPTFGENFGHAIFESFIAGKPVIISNKTPWRDLESLQLGWDLLLEKEEDFVVAIRKALDMDQEQYNILSRKASDFADAFRNNNKTRELYLQLFS